jgi:hypothetical protein
MITFRLTGHFRNRLVNIAWDDGQLVQRMATDAEGQLLGSIPFPPSTHDHLENPYTAYALICMWLAERLPEMHGSLPPIGKPADGEIW